MTDEQINKAIAEACGWTDCNEYIGKPPIKKMDQYNRSLPNYSGCLNAMHEAESMLTYDQFDKYHFQLFKKMLRPYHATAAQRAEAFLRTLEKWEEEV